MMSASLEEVVEKGFRRLSANVARYDCGVISKFVASYGCFPFSHPAPVLNPNVATYDTHLAKRDIVVYRCFIIGVTGSRTRRAVLPGQSEFFGFGLAQ